MWLRFPRHNDTDGIMVESSHIIAVEAQAGWSDAISTQENGSLLLLTNGQSVWVNSTSDEVMQMLIPPPPIMGGTLAEALEQWINGDGRAIDQWEHSYNYYKEVGDFGYRAPSRPFYDSETLEIKIQQREKERGNDAP